MTTEILTDDHHAKSDLRLIQLAIQKGWKIPESVLESLPTVLAGLVVRSDDDRTRINAARVLVAMHGQNRSDNQPKPQTVVNVGVQVDVNARRDQIRAVAERVRARRISVAPAE